MFLTFDETIDDLMRASSKKEEIMKQLVTVIHKVRGFFFLNLGHENCIVATSKCSDF